VIERMHWSRVLSPGATKELVGPTNSVRELSTSSGRGGHSATDARTVRIWPPIATTEVLCDKLTANMSHKQWREWVSADLELGRIVLRATDSGRLDLGKGSRTSPDIGGLIAPRI
jgi:hypothetical protein